MSGSVDPNLIAAAEFEMNETTVLALAVALSLLLGVLIGLGVWLRARSSWERADRTLLDSSSFPEIPAPLVA